MAIRNELRVAFDALRERIIRDKTKRLPDLSAAIEAAFEVGDDEEVDRMMGLRERLEATIEIDELELRLLGNEIGQPFRQNDVVDVRIISWGLGGKGQAEVKIAARDGKTVVRHMHLINGRDRYGNRYATF
ncbi:MAG: hypothetical protein UW46_C0005G0021 [Candidatus Yanofskybacteria bacterium GW2011_GWF1_44_227]|uniref:Uncharacterized protein n=1 Tax=Candidatus Yanofskybacteria bacterium GW2011_GWE2_40_11 TaxID=1619033 RepID=A0A0G0QKN3_9BACT|nr:MAG: hypothetical protein UT69_C0010G0022 [Candidatus Yanofskybacteria bacterium GW2011_GWE1_40_10]KKR40984.1 MAG: hypothetical protein UT75_C0002G0021 [Candidatus Yanofskybacteria bacterium GW2011_GWE2_40_11]KKT15535.1 MAG: hypothetical protein UV97_C0005G0028 [Candidatus Yanofskybacteria bacterium GW2011_GWF2_43_596]KKT53215.1 MAG: hypothetical protein UW46_C0005G0021 [Candidatus Yanofskybacteria bacterium GW2011_GWF1_44_227]OGN35575.1 MAG: hypothetical protein A2207_02440 [Candidatus Yano